MSVKTVRHNLSLIGFFLAMAVVFTSYYFQHAFGFKPCLLCALQRGFFMAIAMVFFLGVAHQYFRGPARFYSFITASLSLLGAVTAGRQIWLQSLPTQPNELCVPGITYLFRQFPFLDAIKIVFTASQECARVEWMFLNISMAGWALVFFLIFFLLSVLVGVKRA